jgi:hypothetical protein
VSNSSHLDGSVSHIEENRKRERQTRLDIAEHDANLIRRLETELLSLQTQHEDDVKLMSDNAQLVNH